MLRLRFLGLVALLSACSDEASSGARLTTTTKTAAHGTVSGTGASGLRVRERPTTSSAVLATLAEGAVVEIACRVEGESVNGNAFWDFITKERGYVSDAFIDRDGTATIPVCAATPDEPDADAGSAVIDGPAVQSHVRFFADEACRVVQACRAATREGHEPSADLALDFPISEAFGKLPTDDYAFGDRLADFAISDMARYRIEYVIYRQRINDGSGWAPMEDRGSITENHLDHVHVSFLP